MGVFLVGARVLNDFGINCWSFNTRSALNFTNLFALNNNSLLELPVRRQEV